MLATSQIIGALSHAFIKTGRRFVGWILFFSALAVAIIFFWVWVAIFPMPLDWAKESLYDHFSQNQNTQNQDTQNRNTQNQKNYDIRFNQAFLTWSKQDFAPAIHVRDLRFTDSSRALSLEVPHASFIIGWESLLQASITPTALFLEGLSLNFDADPSLSQPHTLPELGRLSEIFPALNKQYNQWRALISATGITRLGLRRSSVSLTTATSTWNLDVRELNLLQQNDSLNISADLSLFAPECADHGKNDSLSSPSPSSPLLSPAPPPPVPLNRWTMHYRHAGGADLASFDIQFSPIQVDRLSRCPDAYPSMLRDTSWLRGVSLPISGALRGEMDRHARFGPMTLDLTAGAGIVDIPALQNKAQSFDQAHLKLRLKDHAQHIDILSLSASSNDSTIEASGTAILEEGHYVLRADGYLRDTSIARVKDIWPRHLAVPTRNWATNNIHAGQIVEARASIVMALSDDDWSQADLRVLEGDIDFSDISAEYIEGMPLAHSIEARAVFTKQRFDVSILSADIESITLKEGSVYLYDLDTDIELAHIILPIRESPIRHLMHILDHPPLQARERMEIPNPLQRGMISGQAEFFFPLRKDLRIEDVRLEAKASISDLEIRQFVLNQDIRHADLDLELDSNGMLLQGNAAIGSVQADIQAYYNFQLDEQKSDEQGVDEQGVDEQKSDEEEAERSYQARFTIDPSILRHAGMASYLTGKPSVKLNMLSLRDGGDKITLQIDLTKCAIHVPRIHWHKPMIIPAMLEASLSLDENHAPTRPISPGDISPGSISTESMPIGLEQFIFNSPTVQARGSGLLNHDGTPQKITVDDAWVDGLGRGKMTVDFRNPQRVDATLQAQHIDLSPYFSWNSTTAQLEQPDPKARDFALSFRVDSLRLHGAKPLTNAQGDVYQRQGRLSHVKGKADVGEEHTVQWNVDREDDTTLSLDLRSDNGGEMLRIFDLFDQFDHGDLSLQATIREGSMQGTLDLSDYDMRESSLLLQFLSLPSLTGLFRRLAEGEDMNFEKMHAPFLFDGKTVSFQQANMWNSSLGITFSGTVTTADDTLDIAGEVVPAYTLNSILGNIPILGTLLTNNQQSSILAANYTLRGTLEDPDMTLNPLSTLTPGIFRRIFDIFQTDKPTDAPETESGPKRVPF